MDGYYPWLQQSHTLPPSALSFFKSNGYVVLTSFCTQQEMQKMRLEATNIIQDFQTADQQTSSIFTTNEQTRNINNDFFLSSSANVSCFLEENQNHSASPRAVNKIGHALHDLNPTFASFSRQHKVRSVAHAIGIQNPLVVQSMYILKNAHVGGEVRPHRDASFVIPQRSISGNCLGYWWALQDATLQNGCLYVVPASHLDGVPLREMVREQNGTKFVGNDSEARYQSNEFKPVVVSAGDLVVLHGGVVHKSAQNTSDVSRHAYSIHVVETALADRCWLTRPSDMPFQEL